MPITYVQPGDTGDNGFADVDEGLVNENGNLTQQGELLYQFLSECDFTPLFEEDDLDDVIYVSEGWFIEGEDGELYEADESTPGAEWMQVEAIDGEVAAHLIDEDDLYGMFAAYVRDLSEDTLESRLLKQIGERLLDDEGSVTEATRGWFRRLRNKPFGKEKVNRMLGALLAKGVTSRVGKEKVNTRGIGKKLSTGRIGFVAPIDPDKRGTGYMQGDYAVRGYKPQGTTQGLNNWEKFKRTNKQWAKQDALFKRRFRALNYAQKYGVASVGDLGKMSDEQLEKIISKGQKAARTAYKENLKKLKSGAYREKAKAASEKARKAAARAKAVAAGKKLDAELKTARAERRAARLRAKPGTVLAQRKGKGKGKPAPAQHFKLRPAMVVATKKGAARPAAKAAAKAAAAKNGPPLPRSKPRKEVKKRKVNASLDHTGSNLNEAVLQDQLRVASILEGLAPADPLYEADDEDYEDYEEDEGEDEDTNEAVDEEDEDEEADDEEDYEDDEESDDEDEE